MNITFEELKEKLQRVDEVTLLELLEIRSDDIIERFEDYIEDRQEQLLKEMGTLRNVRELVGFNKELITSAKHQQLRTNRRRQKMNLLAQKLAPVGYMPESSIHSISASIDSFPKHSVSYKKFKPKRRFY